jgi:hypothetical protein
MHRKHEFLTYKTTGKYKKGKEKYLKSWIIVKKDR